MLLSLLVWFVYQPAAIRTECKDCLRVPSDCVIENMDFDDLDLVLVSLRWFCPTRQCHLVANVSAFSCWRRGEEKVTA